MIKLKIYILFFAFYAYQISAMNSLAPDTLFYISQMLYEEKPYQSNYFDCGQDKNIRALFCVNKHINTILRNYFVKVPKIYIGDYIDIECYLKDWWTLPLHMLFNYATSCKKKFPPKK